MKHANTKMTDETCCGDVQNTRDINQGHTRSVESWQDAIKRCCMFAWDKKQQKSGRNPTCDRLCSEDSDDVKGVAASLTVMAPITSTQYIFCMSRVFQHRGFALGHTLSRVQCRKLRGVSTAARYAAPEGFSGKTTMPV